MGGDSNVTLTNSCLNFALNKFSLRCAVMLFRSFISSYKTLSSIFSCLPLLRFVFPGGWRVKSAQTDGEIRCGAPEGKDACCARSDQAEFWSLRGEGVGDDVQLRLAFVLLIGVRQVQCWKRVNLPPSKFQIFHES